MFSKIGLQFRYYRVLSKALLGFSVPDKQPSMTAHCNPNCNSAASAIPLIMMIMNTPGCVASANVSMLCLSMLQSCRCVNAASVPMQQVCQCCECVGAESV